MEESTKLLEFAVVFEKPISIGEELDEPEKGELYSRLMADGIERRLKLSEQLKEQRFLTSEVPFLLGPTPYLVLFAIGTENGAKRLEGAPGVIAVAKSLRPQAEEVEEKGLLQKIKSFIRRRQKEK